MKINEGKVYFVDLAKFMIENKELTTFAGVLAATIQFYLKSFQIDVFLLLGLIVMIAVNTWSGVRLAKKKKNYSLKTLKESVLAKVTGYLILLIALAVFLGILFIAGLRDDTRLFSDYWLNLPLVLLMVFLSAVEFKSTLDNLEDLGIVIPLFVKKIPGKVTDKIDNLTNDYNAENKDVDSGNVAN